MTEPLKDNNTHQNLWYSQQQQSTNPLIQLDDFHEIQDENLQTLSTQEHCNQHQQQSAIDLLDESFFQENYRYDNKITTNMDEIIDANDMNRIPSLGAYNDGGSLSFSSFPSMFSPSFSPMIYRYAGINNL